VQLVAITEMNNYRYMHTLIHMNTDSNQLAFELHGKTLK